ncbi:MAG TPA: hypothetical protein VGE34_01205 [Candidatus Saccharimonadales bacterium]
MNQAQAKELLDQIVGAVFGYQNPLDLEKAMNKFAFDVRLPQQVYEVDENKQSWAASMNSQAYRTYENIKKDLDKTDGLQPYQALGSVEDVMKAWQAVNFAMSERQINSSNVSESDGVYSSNGVYRSVNIRKSKNILFSDGLDQCESVVAGQTSKSCKNSIRVEDSKHVENSFNVIWSNKIVNSYFIQDCFDLYECMFCTHLAGKKFCIANIQLEEAEYRVVKDKITRWILQS